MSMSLTVGEDLVAAAIARGELSLPQIILSLDRASDEEPHLFLIEMQNAGANLNIRSRNAQIGAFGQAMADEAKRRCEAIFMEYDT